MKLNEEIEELNKIIIRMGEQVVENLRIAIELYRHYDEGKAALINDDIVDIQERLIDEMCLNVMVKERPFASDLRVITGILKMVTDLERLADNAEDIRDFSSKLAKVEHHECKILNLMVDKAFEMVRNSVKAYIDKDIALANKVIQEDDIVDKLYDEGLERIVKHLDEQDYSNAFATYTTLVIKYVERIADHAVNVAEWVIYIASGFHKDKKIF